MTGWQHTTETYDMCGTCWDEVDPVGCGTPTPDPTSPCGFVADGMRVPCGMYDIAACHGVMTARLPDYGAHEYAPTRCKKCGHDIAMEADRG